MVLALLAALALQAAAALLLRADDAAALVVYGASGAVPGAGGCLRDPTPEPPGDQACPGEAAGLAGAQAVAVSPDGDNVYVAGEGGVTALARNSVTGALHPARSPATSACIAAAAGSPCAAEDEALSGADALAISPDGRFVYVGASNAATVSAFARVRGGALVPVAQSDHGYFGCVAGTPLAGGSPPGCGAQVSALNGVAALAISPNGRYLYAVSYGLAPGQDSIVTLRRDPASGGLRPLAKAGDCWQSLPGSGCPAIAGLEGATAIAISPDGRFLYVASEVSGAVRGFLRNRSTGALTPLYGLGGCISSGNTPEKDVSCPVTVPQLGGARSIVLSPDGRELYVAAFDPGAVVVLGRNPRSGRLGTRPPTCLQAMSGASCPARLAFLRGATALAMREDGRALYAVTEGGNSLLELTREPDGGLSLASQIPTAADPLSGPVALALAPGGGSIYVASPFGDGVAALTG